MTIATPARLDLRLNAQDKHRIARAAALRGKAVSAFVRDAVLREVETTMATVSVTMLSEAESRHFLAALDAPFQPNPRLQEALHRAAQIAQR